MPINRVYLENFRLFKKKDLILSKDKNFTIIVRTDANTVEGLSLIHI